MEKHNKVTELKTQLLSTVNSDFREEIEKAINFGESKHSSQARESGEPYFTHPLSVAITLADMSMDKETVIAGLLHDVVEDTEVTDNELEELFGPDVAFLVDGVTKIGKIDVNSEVQKQADSFRKLIIFMSKDYRVILIKLADRLHNIRTIDYLRRDKQVRIAKETLNVYAPLAHRLGIAWIKWELEDKAFKALYPEQFNSVSKQIKEKRSEREELVNELISNIRHELEVNDIKNVEITGRPKHFYSIYTKMEKKQTDSIEGIYDLLAVRVLVDTVSDCYSVLGFVHKLWKPVQKRIKDYISMPKANMYQSLHTTIITHKGTMVEFQIRTYDMHKIAEEGIAAHWSYKENANKKEVKKQAEWSKSLKYYEDNSLSFVNAFKEEVLGERIFVFSPKGAIIELPFSATPLDFAYAIHSDVGGRCSGAIVDGKMVPLRYTLKGGEQVRIITNVNQTPKQQWLDFVKTSKAKNKIKTFLNKQQTEKFIATGATLLKKVFEDYGLNFEESVANNKPLVEDVKAKYNLKDLTDLFLAVGRGVMPPTKVYSIYLAEYAPQDEEELKKSVVNKNPQNNLKSRHSSILVSDDLDGIVMKIAKCCNPIQGDAITGYISNGRGIIVHRSECPNILKSPEERLIDVHWNDKMERIGGNVWLIVEAFDNVGLLHKASDILQKLSINIKDIKLEHINDQVIMHLYLSISGGKSSLETAIGKINSIKGVQKIYRK